MAKHENTMRSTVIKGQEDDSKNTLKLYLEIPYTRTLPILEKSVHTV